MSDSNKGFLQLLSPEEELHAAIIELGIFLDNAPTDEEVDSVIVWMQNCLIDARKVASREEVFWESNRWRERLGNKFAAMYMSPTQRCK